MAPPCVAPLVNDSRFSLTGLLFFRLAPLINIFNALSNALSPETGIPFSVRFGVMMLSQCLLPVRFAKFQKRVKQLAPGKIVYFFITPKAMGPTRIWTSALRSGSRTKKSSLYWVTINFLLRSWVVKPSRSLENLVAALSSVTCDCLAIHFTSGALSYMAQPALQPFPGHGCLSIYE